MTEHKELITAPRGSIIAADAFAKVLDIIDGGIHFIADQFRDAKPLDQAQTADDVIRYANSIRDKDPSFANELIAAANRSKD